MADQGKWFKLWCSSLHDETLENLELEDWARWARLGAYIKEHGKDGKIRFNPPYRALMNLFRVTSLDAIKVVLQRFPNCVYGEVNRTVSPETVACVSLEIEYQNWFRYQSDFSTYRVRKHREHKRRNETLQEEKRSRRDVEENKNTPIVPKGTDKVFDWFEKTWQQYPKERRVGKKASWRSYQKDVKTLEEAKTVMRALENYLKTETVKNGFVKNASTFFANWRDYADNDGRNSQGVHHANAVGASENVRPGDGERIASANDALRSLADRKSFPA